MPKIQRITEKQLNTAASAIKEIRPAYGSLIDFYREVFLAQEKSRKSVDKNLVAISNALQSPMKDHDVSLVKLSDFPFDYAEADRLLGHLLDLAQRLAPNLAHSADALKKALQKGRLESHALVDALLKGNNGMIHEIGESQGIPVQDLVFFAYGAIAPSIYTCASRLAQYLKDRPPWTKGSCPVCGSRPDMAFFDRNGARHLVCGFCMHEWAFQRMGCVFCGNRDADKQHYFYHEEEKEYRMDLCDHCRRYLKLVDVRKLPREFYPRLEQVGSLHLDMKARENGYERGSDG